MKFSIIVPIYNVEEYLDRCVKSLVEQTYNDIEIILVDDDSPDSCPQICDMYEHMDSRIHVVHKENGGLSDARNAGLKIARGEYIIFVDADDYIDVDTCERLVRYTEEGIDIIIADAVVEGGKVDLNHIEEKEILNGKQYLLNAYKANKAPMAAWLNIYKRLFLIENNIYFKKGILHEDEEFTPRAFLGANKVIVTGQSFYHYIIRENSITTQKDKRKNADDLYSTCIELLEIYQHIENQELREYLVDSLVAKYLSLFQAGKIIRYGKKYLHKEFIKKNATLSRTKRKAKLYCLSPRLYYEINYILKKIMK